MKLQVRASLYMPKKLKVIDLTKVTSVVSNIGLSFMRRSNTSNEDRGIVLVVASYYLGCSIYIMMVV
jgi:hypothetical protein